MGVHGATAIFAFPGSGDAGDQNRVAGTKHRDARAYLVDQTDALMAEDAAGSAGREVAFENVQVGPQIVVLVIFTMASVGALISGTGRSPSTLLPGP
jgi:hypothetical protein